MRTVVAPHSHHLLTASEKFLLDLTTIASRPCPELVSAVVLRECHPPRWIQVRLQEITTGAAVAFSSSRQLRLLSFIQQHPCCYRY
jgi:hypothetical protein